jgi:hypothetical protein
MRSHKRLPKADVLQERRVRLPPRVLNHPTATVRTLSHLVLGRCRYLANAADAEDFGLDAYEPKFKNTQDEWGEAQWSVVLTLNDATYDGDLFCELE